MRRSYSAAFFVSKLRADNIRPYTEAGIYISKYAQIYLKVLHFVILYDIMQLIKANEQLINEC
jgi:hypothetical protein